MACTCNEGFTGDGFTCAAEQIAAPLVCPPGYKPWGQRCVGKSAVNPASFQARIFNPQISTSVVRELMSVIIMLTAPTLLAVTYAHVYLVSLAMDSHAAVRKQNHNYTLVTLFFTVYCSCTLS